MSEVYNPNNIQEDHVVQMLSGGTIMTVQELNGDMAHCVWFDGTKRMSDDFKLSNLKRVDPET